MSKKLADNKMHQFFETLADACKHFRHLHAQMPGANCKGCRVTVGTKPHQRGQAVFQFIAKNEKEVSIKIDFLEASNNPKRYFNSLMEQLNDRYSEMTKRPVIFIPKNIQMYKAIRAIH